MTKNIYFDTNVIVDLFDEKRPFYSYSLEVFQKLFADESLDVFINTDSMTNLFYILRSHVKLDFDTAIEKIEFIKDSFTIVSSEIEEIEQTIAICKKRTFNDYEDAMQYVCALKAECTLLITNNPKDFKNATVDVVTTKELCDFWGS